MLTAVSASPAVGSAHHLSLAQPGEQALRGPAFLAHEFHLAVADETARHKDSGANGDDVAAAAPVVVPRGLSLLRWDASLRPALSATKATADRAPVLEPLPIRDGQPRLLLACPSNLPATVNGAPAPRLCLLSEGDLFHFQAGPAFKLLLYFRPQVAPVPQALVGVPCAVCSLALAEGDRCLVCECETPVHAAEDETQPGALACVKMVTHCPHCQARIRLVPGYGERSGADHASPTDHAARTTQLGTHNPEPETRHD